MANGPEAKDRIADELRKFQEQLDGPPDDRIVLPGFLFRNGADHKYKPLMCRSLFMDGTYPPGIKERITVANNRLANIDWDFVKVHAETYRKALEAQREILNRIQPTEILEQVQVEWGLGEVKTTETGACIGCLYTIVLEEVKTSTSYTERYDPINGNPSFSRTYSYKTGKWFANRLPKSLSIDVFFEEGTGDCYAEYRYDPNSKEFPRTTICGITNFGASRNPDFKFANGTWVRNTDNLELFRGIPQKISRRPDTLYVLLKGNFDYECHQFDPAVSKQEIVDFLAGNLEQEKACGELPYQLEALGLAKIKELQKRGLFVESGK